MKGVPSPTATLALDAFGALVSSVSLGGLLVMFQPWIGMPVGVLYLLAALPVGFGIFDLYALFSQKQLARRLRQVAGLNLFYCLLSLVLTIAFASSLTGLGWAYFGAELAIVIAIVALELAVANGAEQAG